MSRFFQLVVNEDRLTDELYRFVTDPSPARGDRAVVDELHTVLPEAVDVLECMVLDGVEDRQFVAEYVHHLVSDMTLSAAHPAQA